jgi:hypothetical protein
MALQFKRATKQQAKLRCALFGPSGAGKTMSALRIAAGLGGPVAFIDSEKGTASKYADRWTFDVLDLEKRTIADYIDAIHAAGAAGYPVVCIDSISHAWQELLEEVDKLARAKYRGNTWSAWSEGTPKQRRFIDAIQGYPGHVIATIRSRTEWTTEDVNGKKQPVRVGLAPETGKGAEYEFDLLLEISQEHIARVIKDRTGKFQDKLIEKPDEDFGRELAAWLDEGAAPTPKPEPTPEPNTTSVTINGKVHQTAGILRDDLLKVWDLSRLYDKAKGKDAAKALLKERVGVDSTLALTADTGAQFLAIVREELGREGVDLT